MQSAPTFTNTGYLPGSKTFAKQERAVVPSAGRVVGATMIPQPVVRFPTSCIPAQAKDGDLVISSEPRQPKCLAKPCTERATHKVRFAGRGFFYSYCHAHAVQYARVNTHPDNLIKER